MQALSSWIPPEGVLGALVADARERAAALEAEAPSVRRRAAAAAGRPSLRAALGGDRVAVIAELKRRSPSKGDINPGLPLEERARAYAHSGAAALSVLTQPSHFGGASGDLAAVAAAVHLPVLRKDFLVSPLQLLEARALGASAVLLIARALSPEELPLLARVAADAGLETLIEVRDESELERALAAGADVVGVNNRNLETLEIDARVSELLLPLVPASIPAVYESGIAGRAGVEHAARCGADAVLVGSSLSASADGAAALRAITGVGRLGRGGR
ncbi:MAG: indole-3-glycerol phosphate synthase TrpC [Gemmatimonadaceae bacterium]